MFHIPLSGQRHKSIKAKFLLFQHAPIVYTTSIFVSLYFLRVSLRFAFCLLLFAPEAILTSKRAAVTSAAEKMDFMQAQKQQQFATDFRFSLSAHKISIGIAVK